MTRFKFLVIFQFLTFCLCEISLDEKGKLANGFVKFYNSLPNQAYFCEQGYLHNAQHTDISNAFNIEVILKVSAIHNPEEIKYLKCTAQVADINIATTVFEPGVVVLRHECLEDQRPKDNPANVEEVTETVVTRKPIELDNEVQTNTAVTSGEQFIAVPREDQKKHCIGCSSHVNPQAEGVSDLAAIGIRQLNSLDPTIQHTLNSVIDVERQVQVVNGIRYILTLIVDYNSCSKPESNEPCIISNACKITILEKPWMQLSDGSKFRAILANNCTEEWRFGDDGVVVDTTSDKREDNNINPTSDGNSDDIIKPVQAVNVQAQQQTEKTLTDKDIKNIEEQIIPNDQLQSHVKSTDTLTITSTFKPSDGGKDHVEKVESETQYSPNAIPPTKPHKVEGLEEDKKKAIDDLINIFNFADLDSNVDSNSNDEIARVKRSFNSDLHILNIAEKYRKLKKSIDNSKHIYFLAQSVVDYMNQIDLDVKNRVLKDVTNAEKESENQNHFFYIQFRTVIPCDDSVCEKENKSIKLCNAIIDDSEKEPQILNVFCHDEDKNTYLGKRNSVPLDDPLLLKLISESIKKMEIDSQNDKALKLNKIIEATTQKFSGTLTKVSLVLDEINCNKTVPFKLRSNCSVVEKAGSTVCDVTIHERHWIKDREITYSCIERPIDISFSKSGDGLKKGIADPKVRDVLQDALRYLEDQSNRNNKQVLVSVLSVSTQLVAGFLTKIEFVVAYTNCANDVKIEDSSNCKLLENEPLRKCIAKVWDRAWIEEDENKFEVLCDESNEVNKRKKRSAHELGPKLGDETEQDASDPQYKALAEESMKKYLQDTGISVLHRVTVVDKVTTQVVAGTITRIFFKISPLLENLGDVLSCTSQVFEQPWLKKKEITVNCQIDDTSSRGTVGAVPGGELQQDVNDPKYKALAEESMKKYLQDSGNSRPHKVVKVERVTTQIVSGVITHIYFKITPLSSSSEDVISCESKIYEQPWLNNREITAHCKKHNTQSKEKHSIHGVITKVGGETEQDANDPKYKALAEESMKKYLKDTGNLNRHRVVSVQRVTTQIVSGSLTRISFNISPLLSNSGDVISCTSQVWEQPWLKKKEITVNCQIDDTSNRGKREVHDNMLVGGETQQDANDPKYKALAEESMNKYLQDTGNSNRHKIVSVQSVTTQVVSGSLTRISFNISPLSSNSGDVINCTSEVWERPWLNKKEITVNCQIDDTSNRGKREVHDNMLVGGETQQDANDPKYKALAEESMNKYLQDTGNSNRHKIVSVQSVTTQVVSGSLTRISFIISPLSSNSGDVINCKSEVWERPWLNKKEITVNCQIDDTQSRAKRNIITGGLTAQDPNSPKYRILAEQSLAQYLSDIGNKDTHDVVNIKSVATQVVSGIKTIIHFNIASKVMPTKIISCKSYIWEKPWRNKTEINVNCQNDNHVQRNKREIKKYSNKKMVGAVEEQDATKAEYKDLAEQSLTKYKKHQTGLKFHIVAKVKKVTTQIVSGVRYTIDFVAAPRACAQDVSTCDDMSTVLNCHTVIKHQPWLSHKEIDVVCNSPHKRNKRVVTLENRRNNIVLSEISDNEYNIDQHPHKRQTDDDEVEDDLKFYYSDRALHHLNTESKSKNLYKLITIHGMHSSVQMDNTPMIRMYLEVAETFCLRHFDEDHLAECEEMDAMNHKLCLARLYPSPDDEMIVQLVSIVCDDDDKFESITGISMPTLIRASLESLEKPRQMLHKLVHLGEPHLIPSLDSNLPFKLNFIAGTTNCTKNVESYKKGNCFLDSTKPSKACTSYIWLVPNSRTIDKVIARCGRTESRQRRSISLNTANATVDDLLIQKLVQESLDKLEMATPQKYKQRVLNINSYSTKVTSGKITTIDFEVGFTSCLKYAWVDDISSCELMEHLPRRRCVSQIWERLWLENGRDIEVTCKDEDEPLEAHVEFESAALAKALARRALKHIEAKYPHPHKQKVVRIFSLDKQVVAGVHYRMKVEVATTNCSALSNENMTYCKPYAKGGSENKFCTVNVWLRPWTDHPPNYRVSCDYQDGAMAEMYHQIQAEHLFREFVTTYMPDYMNDHEEIVKRFEIFRANIRKMHELNTHERGTASYGVTRFADLTYEEFTTKHLGLKQSVRDVNQVPMRKAVIPNVDVPDMFDWRKHGAVTEVKNQGSCGSCWAFSVTGNIEGQWQLKSGKLVSLSEQELVDCDTMDDGCNGGLPDNAYRAIEQLGGLETENDYPYEGEGDKCSFNKTLSKVQISGAVNISSNETDMAKWLVSHGPISIGINANAMQFYMGGVSHPWKMLCNPKNLDHGVLIVGYGIKNYPLFNKRLPYWIVKNSWGPTWGEQGYYRVYRGDGTCGVNQMASSAVI